MPCCDPCVNPTPDFVNEIVVPAGGSASVLIPTQQNTTTCRRDINCAVIDRRGEDVDAVLTPDRDDNPIDCTLIQPGNIDVEPWGPFINPGVITLPSYADNIILCNSGTEDVTVIVEFYGGCGCGELCDPNQDPIPVTIDDQPVTVEQAPAAAATAAPVVLVTSAAGSTTDGIAQLNITNVGSGNATIDGFTFPPGASFSLEAYLDPVTNIYNRVGSVDYDATVGPTELLVAELP